MKKYIWIIAVVAFIFSLSGCADIAADPVQMVNEDISKGTPRVLADEPAVSSDSTELTVEADKKAGIPETERPSTETVKPQETPAAQSQEVETPAQQETTPTSKPTEPPKQADPKPSEQPKAQETKPPATSEPTTEPETKPETKPETTPPAKTEPPTETPPTVAEPVEPAFNINDWIAYAQSYATSVGLRLESSAVDCWDNPITAGAHSQYLERDIQGMLNRYARDEDITDVWIWAQSRSDGSYDLYIGYA